MAIAADRIGAANAIFAACVILIVCVALFYFLSTTLRNLDNLVEAAATKIKAQNGEADMIQADG